MDLNIATIPKEEALVKFEEYKHAVARSRNAADRLLMKAYKAISEGYGVLKLTDALIKGGVDERTWLPRLAAMRADQELVYFRRQSYGAGLYSYSERYYLSRRVRKAQNARLQFSVPERSLAGPSGGIGQPADSQIVEEGVLIALESLPEVESGEEIILMPTIRRCRACGCTKMQACEGGCTWVELTLCSRCEVAK